jgi:hypothetical protein
MTITPLNDPDINTVAQTVEQFMRLDRRTFESSWVAVVVDTMHHDPSCGDAGLARMLCAVRARYAGAGGRLGEILASVNARPPHESRARGHNQCRQPQGKQRAGTA